MNEEQLQMILSYLDKIAAKLNIGLHQIWPWFIKQQYLDAYVSFGLLLTTIIIAGIFFFVTVKLWRKDDKYSKKDYYYVEGERTNKPEDRVYAYSIYHQSHEIGWIWANVICMVVVFLAGFMFYVDFFDIFNPEYAAFKDLLTAVKTSSTPK